MTAPVRHATEAIARYAVESDLRALSTGPLGTVDHVRRSLIDTLGVVIAARDEESVRIARRVFADPLPAGPSQLLFDSGSTTPEVAAVLNGVAAHALDFDDVTEIMYGHPSAALWPALIAVAQERGSTERQLLEAFVAGFTVIVAACAGMDVRRHYARGWHSSATFGVLGATAGAARLAGLDVEQTRRALGIAVSMAGGSRQNFGTMTKPLHIGLLARDAVVATRLAEAGFTADPDAVEAPLGFYAMFDAGADLDAVLSVLGGPEALPVSGLNVKKYPCCFNTHRTADAILDLIARDDLKPDEVTAVTVTLEPGGFDPLIHHRPSTGLEAKFSAEYVVAAALLDRKVGLRSFTDPMVARPEAQELVRQVSFAESPEPPTGPREWEYAYSSLQVETTRGAFEFRTDYPRGDRRLPLTPEELDSKFLDCADFADRDGEALLSHLRVFGGSTPFEL